ncbi:hypothetical protein [Williamsia sp. R60]
MTTIDTDKETPETPETPAPDVPEAPETPTQEDPNVTVTDTPEGSDPQGDTGPAASETPEASEEPAGDPDTFDRAYVAGLRKESAGYRTQLREVQEQLHRAMVEKSGALADPADLPFDADHLQDPEALTAAIQELLAAKPHLKARRFVGDVGQGNRESATAGVDLLGILRSRA